MNNQEIANLTLQLQRSLDGNYDVVDMQTVLCVIQQLESTTITQEQLETTRLARYINQLRRRTTSDVLARRAKNLLKRWRDSFMPALQQHQTGTASIVPSATQATTTPPISITAAASSAIPPSPYAVAAPSAISTISPGYTIQANVPISPMLISNNSCKSLAGSANNSKGSMSNGDYLSYLNPNNISKRHHTPTTFTNVLGTQLQSAREFPFGHANVVPPPQQQPPRPPSSSRLQSPITLLDFDSNQSRPATSQPSNITPTKQKVRINGDSGCTTIPICTAAPATIVDNDLHDSNSVIISTADHQQQNTTEQSQHLLYSTPSKNPNAAVTDSISSSSGHRKSKKHKKDKRRNKLGPDKTLSSVLQTLKTKRKDPLLADSGTSFLPYVEEVSEIVKIPCSDAVATAAADDEDSLSMVPPSGSGNNSAAGVFPPHDSLSSSSMSRFPSNLNANTMSMPNSSRPVTNNGTSVENQSIASDMDLTFAGKFKNVGNTSTELTSVDAQLPIEKITPIDSKDSLDVVVVVESQSSSSFHAGQINADDSCSSSIRAMDTVNSLTIDSNVQLQPLSLLENIPNNSLQATSEGIDTNRTIVEQQQQQQPPQPFVTVETPAPKRRGRKKGSRGIDAVIAQTHAFNMSMFERPRLIFGSKKVKTTKELLADIQNRKFGSSATSSPTLASNRQSVSPSTCSEASFQSDLTNTRASVTQRSSPDLSNTVVNSRQSDLDDVNSATDSNDAVGLSKLTAATQKVDTKSVSGLPPVDEYLQNLRKLLPPIDRTKLDSIDSDEHLFVCACSVRKLIRPPTPVEVVVNDTSNSSEIVTVQIAKSDGLSVSNIASTQSPIDHSTNVDVQHAASIGSSTSPKKSPKKPVKSIFDLDYDEDNDPLHSFVEAAKLKHEQAKLAEEKVDNLDLADNLDENRCRSIDLPTMNSLGKSIYLSNSTSPHMGISTDNMAPSALQASASSTATLQTKQPPDLAVNFFQPAETLDDNMLPAQQSEFSTFEVVEDENCAAKQRFEIQTNCVTKYHINSLHNFYIPNVNGNWSGPISMTPEHRKQIRRYRLKRMKKSENTTIEGCSSNNIEPIDSDDNDGLYERVVPEYGHIIMDKIVKDLSDIQFNKNYLKKKMKTLNKLTAMKLAAAQLLIDETKAEGDDEKAAPMIDEETVELKDSNNINDVYHKGRKRLRSLWRDSLENLSCDDGGGDDSNSGTIAHVLYEQQKSVFGTTDDLTELAAKMHKYQKRRKRRKLRYKIDENEQPKNAENDRNVDDNESSITFDSYTKMDGLFATTIDIEKDLNSSLKELSFPPIPCIEDSSRDSIISDTVLKKDSRRARKKKKRKRISMSTATINEPQLEDITESNSRDKLYNCDVNFVANDYLNQNEFEAENENENEEPTDYDADPDANNEDDYYNGQFDDDEEEHNSDEHEHEVVTHDMTSSTFTTSQQHIVLTIKKKTPKSSLSSWSSRSKSLKQKSSEIIVPDQHLSILNSSPTSIRIRRRNWNASSNTEMPVDETTLTTTTATNEDIGNADKIDNNNILCNKSTINLDGNNEDKQKQFGDNELNDVLDHQSDQSLLQVIKLPIKSSISIEDVSTMLIDTSNQPDTVDDRIKVTILDNDDNENAAIAKDINTGCANGNTMNNAIDGDCSKKKDNVVEKMLIDDFDKDENSADESEADNDIPNNGLLKSFNSLSDKNRLGLCIVKKDGTIDKTLNTFDPSDEGLMISEQHLAAKSDTDTVVILPNDSLNSDQFVQEFHEWHEVLQLPSYNEELLTILPYVVID